MTGVVTQGQPVEKDHIANSHAVTIIRVVGKNPATRVGYAWYAAHCVVCGLHHNHEHNGATLTGILSPFLDVGCTDDISFNQAATKPLPYVPNTDSTTQFLLLQKAQRRTESIQEQLAWLKAQGYELVNTNPKDEDDGCPI